MLNKHSIFSLALLFFGFNYSTWADNSHGAYLAPKKSFAPIHAYESPVDATPTDYRKIRNAKSRMIRSENEICVVNRTNQLPEGAYTNWWIVYNKPEHCTGAGPLNQGQCSFEDSRNSAVEASVFRAASGVVGPTNRGFFDSCVTAGETPVETIRGNGIENTNAEIHVIFKWHDEAKFADPQLFGEQLTTLRGNCDEFADNDHLGRVRCPDVQISIHPSLHQ